MNLRRRSFAVRYLTLFGGEAFSKLCVLAAFAYLARTLGPREFGIVELAISVTIFFVLGVESGLGSYGARIVAAKPEMAAVLVPRIGIVRAALGVPAYLAILAGSAYYGLPGLGIVAIYGLTVLATPLFTQWVSQGLRQMHWVAIGTATRNFVFALLVLLIVREGSDVRLVAVAEIGAVITFAAVNSFVLHVILKVRTDWRAALRGAVDVFRDTWYLGASDLTWACLWYSPTLVLGAMGIGRTEHVAWLAASVRIVLALHTFVFLYFFNMLPNLAKELADGIDQWRDLVKRSVATSMWPACLVALGGTLIAPVLVRTIYGPQYGAAVLPFQIVVWMIPVAWFSGHHRFSLIAAGKQRWEFIVSAVTGVATIAMAVVLVYLQGSPGAAAALLLGGILNAVLAVLACGRTVAPVSVWEDLRPVVVTTAACLALGLAVGAIGGPLVGASVGCLAYVAVAVRQDNELVRLSHAWLHR